jgi:DNA-binding HxlR family transcriptional regulator
VPRLTEKDIERISAAVAEPRRFKILKDLAAWPGTMSCSTIIDKHGVSAATISHHLKELEDATCGARTSPASRSSDRSRRLTATRFHASTSI